jgi:uncharacterized repeat protein (TIGR01451 family)
MGGRTKAARRRILTVGAVAVVLMPGAFGSVAEAGFDVTADVSITKSDGVASVDAGGTVTYTIVVSNAGPDAVSPTVTDPMPAEFASMEWTCTPAGIADCAFAAGTGSLEDYPNLPVAGSVTYTVTGTVRVNESGLLANTATVVGAFNDQTPDDHSATDETTINPVDYAELEISKVVQGPVVAGQQVTYGIQVVNNAGAATSATVTDVVTGVLPDATWTCGASVGSSCTNAAGSGDINETVTVGSFSSVDFEVTGTLDPGAAGSVSNTATVVGALPDPDPTNNAATSSDGVAVVADVSVDKTGPATAMAGDDLTYVLTVANGGPSDGSDVALSDALPSGTTFVSVAQTSGPAATIVAPAVGAGGVVTASWASFATGGTATFDVVVNIGASVVAGDTITNTATVTEGASQAVGFFGLAGGVRPQVDPNPANDASTVVTEIVAGPVVTTTTDPPGPTTTTETPVSTTQPPATTSTTVASAAGELPRTGSDTGTIGWLAALLVVAGAATVVVGTYRRREV